MQSQRSLLLNPAHTALVQGRNQNDVFVNPLPCPHVYGSVVFNANFLCGATLVLLERFTEEGMLEAVQTHRGTGDGYRADRVLLPARAPEIRQLRPDLADALHVGGQTLPAAKSIEFTERTGVPVLELWGMTELSGAGTSNPALGINKPGTLGPALPGTSVKIVGIEDPETEMPFGERGELMIKGPLVMQGYYGNEQATAETIRQDGWMHTGDIATMDEDAYLTIVDRKKDMILTAGYNIYPSRTGARAVHASLVALAAVCGVPDDAKGEIAKAYVVARPGTNVGGRELVSHCREHLAAYKTPRAIQFVDDVPITSSGKIMRRLLSDLDDGTRSID